MSLSGLADRTFILCAVVVGFHPLPTASGWLLSTASYPSSLCSFVLLYDSITGCNISAEAVIHHLDVLPFKSSLFLGYRKDEESIFQSNSRGIFSLDIFPSFFFCCIKLCNNLKKEEDYVKWCLMI